MTAETVGELRALIADLPDDTKIRMYANPEQVGYGPMVGATVSLDIEYRTESEADASTYVRVPHRILLIVPAD